MSASGALRRPDAGSVLLARQRRRTHAWWAAALAAIFFGHAAAQSAAGREEVRFDILAYNVVGNSVLSVDEIETAVYPFLGESRTLADAERARAALESAYASRGFLSVAVTLPPQASVDGEITLQVTEARIGRRRVTGAQYNLPSVIADALPSIAPGTVPDFNELQADLGRAQTASALELTPLLSAGASPDRLDIDVKVKDELPLHASVELNNKQTFNGPRGRLEASVRYDNLFQRQHSIGLNWIVAPASPGSSSTWVLSYGAPLAGGRLNSSLVHSDSSTPTNLGGATVSRGHTLGLRWRLPLQTFESGTNHGVTLGVDWKDNEDASRNVAGFTTETPALRYPVFALGWDFFAGADSTAQTSADLSIAFGNSKFGSREVDCNGVIKDQFDCKRAGAKPTFQVLRGSFAHRWRFSSQWEGKFRLQAQLADAALTSGEQIGAGGFDTVRGYYEYEQVGDRGLIVRSEIGAPPLALDGLLSLALSAFGDYAYLQSSDALPGESGSARLGSVGLSLRALSGERFSLRLDYALPLIGTVKPDSSGAALESTGARRARLGLSARLAL